MVTTTPSHASHHSVYFDGASKSNPGEGGCGAVIYDKQEEVALRSMYLGSNVTNNYAEYSGLVIGLQLALKENIMCLNVYGDSMLVINQMNHVWKVKSPALFELYSEAQQLAKCFDKITFIHVKRHFNKRADELANDSLK